MSEGRSDGHILLFFGMLAWAAAAYFTYVAYSIPVQVEVPDATAMFPTGVANVHAMHIQALNFHVAIGLAIIGTLLICAAAILKSLSQSPLPPS